MRKKKILQNKEGIEYIQNMLPNGSNSDEFVSSYFKPLLHNGLGTILRNSKSKGISPYDILKFLVLLPFLGLSTINSCFRHPFLQVGKDTLYRFKNNEWIPWRKLLYSVARRFLKLANESTEAREEGNKKQPTCFIFDDTDIPKTGVLMEGISKIWSHVGFQYILGYKALVCQYFDGISAVGIDFSLHREQGSKKKKQYGLRPQDLQKQFTKRRAADSYGAQRQSELDETKINVVLQMIKRAIQQGFKAEYVLTDTWFFCEALLKLVVLKGMDLVSGVKMGNLNFSYKGKNYSPKALLSIVKRKAKYDRKLKIHYIPLIVSYKGVQIKLFFVRYGNQEKWRIIVCSNTKLSFQQVLKVYQIRWSIEIFFKEMKQYLGLKECHSRDFDAHITHLSLGMMTYMALALKKRVNCHQTLGQLFRGVKSEFMELTIVQKVKKWFLLILMELTDLFDREPKFIFQKLNQPTVFNRFEIIFNE